MSLTINDLQPKAFTITVEGVELQCQPPKLRHVLLLTKLGEVFQNAKSATINDIEQAEVELDKVISELIPELAGKQINVSATLAIIEQVMNQIQPDDNKELNEQGVSLSADPKAPKIG